MISEFVLLLLLGALALAWFNNRKAQEIAVAHCRHVCKTAGLQFLDDVAPISRLKLVRNDGGTIRLQRIYSFDYATAQGDRRTGSLVMLGRRPMAWQIEGRTVFDVNDPLA